jgi:hypothetical protein
MTSILSQVNFTGQTTAYSTEYWPVDQEFPFTSVTGYWKVNSERLECRTAVQSSTNLYQVQNQTQYQTKTSICRLKSSIWTQAFHLPGVPNGGRRISISIDITMPSVFPLTGYQNDDDLHAGIMYLGESSGKGFCWLYQNIGDGTTVRYAHAYVDGTTATPVLLGPSVSTTAWAAGSTHTMIVQVHLNIAGDIIDSTLFVDGVPISTFGAVSAPLYNYLFNVSISSFVSKNFYQGLVCRNFTDAGLALQSASSPVPAAWQTYLHTYVRFSTNAGGFAYHYGLRNVIFDKWLVRDVNPGTLLPPLDTEPALGADFTGYTQISTALENNTTSDTLTVPPSYSQPISDQWEVVEFNSDAGFTTTYTPTTRRRRRWDLGWVALPTADKDTLVNLTASVQSRFRSFAWTDPETNESLNIRFTSDVQVNRVAYAAWNVSAQAEEVLG